LDSPLDRFQLPAQAFDPVQELFLFVGYVTHALIAWVQFANMPLSQAPA
jgi:hypothetical protein